MENVLVTGGAGFIGSNIASTLLKKRKNVTILDNFSRDGSRHNAAWLKSLDNSIKIVEADTRNFDAIKEAAAGKDTIFHTAGQVAVTSSIINPREDFDINALGTFNVLEAARENDSAVIYCSTNKVYGNNVNNVPIEELPKRYEFSGDHKNGIKEEFSIDANHHTPYGVSKLVGEKYVREYGSLYGLKTVANRMSCIYGTQQFGTADQGWISHFIRSFIFDRPITIYGDGKQVRDVLFISDLVDLFIKEAESDKKIHGNVFNVGGGKANTLSLIELIEHLKKISGKKPSCTKDEWRAADQKVYYSDISKAMSVFGWEPKISPEEGVKSLFDWTICNRHLFE